MQNTPSNTQGKAMTSYQGAWDYLLGRKSPVGRVGKVLLFPVLVVFVAGVGTIDLLVGGITRNH